MNNLDPYDAFAKYLADGFDVLGSSFRPVIPAELVGNHFIIKKLTTSKPATDSLTLPPRNINAFDGIDSQVSCNISILPALLAIRLGYSDQVVQALMELNGASIRDIDMQFSEYDDSTKVMVDVEGRSLSPNDVERRLREAIATSERLSHEAQKILATENGYAAAAYKMIFVENEELWPATRISRQLESKNTRNLDIFKGFYESEGEHDLPNGSYDELFIRLGVTIPAVVNSKYFKPMFFEDLIERAYVNDTFAAEILTYGLNHPNPTTQKAFARGVTYSLVFEVERFDEGDTDNVLAFIKNELESTKHFGYAQSLVTELNLLPVGFDPDEDELDSSTYPGLSESSTVVKRLITELMATAPGDVAFGQFHALGNLTTLCLPEQDISGIDHAKAVHYLMAAYTAFTDGNPQLKNYQDNAYLHKRVHACLETFLTILPKDQFTYEGLEGLSQDQILMLATAGFDMLKLPKMELPTMGRHFTNQLGI